MGSKPVQIYQPLMKGFGLGSYHRVQGRLHSTLRHRTERSTYKSFPRKRTPPEILAVGNRGRGRKIEFEEGFY